MKLLKQHESNDMLDVYKCPYCNKPEYYGMFHWHNGHQYCRECIYNIWSEEGYVSAKHKEDIQAAKEDREPVYDNLNFWRPTEEDFIFPLYSDGVNYYE